VNRRPPLTGARRTELARQALRAAIRVRIQLDVPPTKALCIYDAAEGLGVEVRFVDIPSMEGMYVRNSGSNSQPIILVSALRPAGRQATTTAHELGHHAFGHGTRIDQYIAGADEQREENTLDSDEIIANMFAGFFLMPKAAVEHGFAARACAPVSATPRQVFAVACWLGVGYGTLIHHMRSSLGMLSAGEAKALLSIQPKRIRQEILGAATSSDCFLVDHTWTGRPLDLQIGDAALVAAGVEIESSCLTLGQRATPDGLQVVESVATGLGRLVGSTWATFVRVRPRGFVGRSIFRHLESAEDEQ
jgi:Zn-dependent peptidase ImmA (M78 family)